MPLGDPAGYLPRVKRARKRRPSPNLPKPGDTGSRRIPKPVNPALSRLKKPYKGPKLPKVKKGAPSPKASLPMAPKRGFSDLVSDLVSQQSAYKSRKRRKR